jgi:putative NIF3 family GTP cyclohydrolase 1 type 2
VASNLTADAVVQKIRTEAGQSWLPKTSEGFECGDGNAIIAGIAVMWTPSIDALHKAVSMKHNLVISMEPPFWRENGEVKTEVSMGPPPVQAIEGSAVYQYKKKLIDDNGIVIWRFNENYKTLPGNPRLTGLAKTLGYNQHQNTEATHKLADTGAGVYTLPETSLIDLAKECRENARAKALRVLGDPAAKISSVAVLPGYMTNELAMSIVRGRNVDAIVCGEACEWEAFEYAEDWITAGWGKGMIMLGRAASEDPGAQEMATWMKSFITEVPVTGISVGEPFSYVPAHKG